MKKFVCFWGVGYNDEGETAIVSDEWFCNDRGYSDEMIEKVSEMDIHDTVDCTEMGAHHVVLRVE